jgi:hypothetical protein
MEQKGDDCSCRVVVSGASRCACSGARPFGVGGGSRQGMTKVKKNSRPATTKMTSDNPTESFLARNQVSRVFCRSTQAASERKHMHKRNGLWGQLGDSNHCKALARSSDRYPIFQLSDTTIVLLGVCTNRANRCMYIQLLVRRTLIIQEVTTHLLSKIAYCFSKTGHRARCKWGIG